MTSEEVAAHPKYSRLANIAARVGITVVAFALLCLLRQDLFAWTWDHAHALASDTAHRVRSPYIISGYMKNVKERKLQLGAGHFNMPGG